MKAFARVMAELPEERSLESSGEVTALVNPDEIIINSYRRAWSTLQPFGQQQKASLASRVWWDVKNRRVLAQVELHLALWFQTASPSHPL